MKRFKSFKKYIATALAVIVTSSVFPLGVYAQAQHEEIQSIDYYLDQDIPFISEDEFSELKEDTVILAEIPLDDYTTLIQYEYEDSEGKIEGRSVVVFKVVTMKTFAGLANSNVMGRLNGMVSSASFRFANQHTSQIRSAVRNAPNRAGVFDAVQRQMRSLGCTAAQARDIANATNAWIRW